MKLRIIIVISYLLSASSTSSAHLNLDSRLCPIEGRFAGGIATMREMGLLKGEAKLTANGAYNTSEYADMNHNAHHLIDEIYEWSWWKTLSYKPYEKSEIIEIEKEFEQACKKRHE